MKKIDIARLKAEKVAGTISYEDIDGSIVELTESKVSYQEIRRKPNSPFKTGYEYHKSSLTLKGGGTFFYNFPVGIVKEYDEQGNVTKEVNYDQLCNYSIDDLVKKIKKKYKLDLLSLKDGVSVHRYIDVLSKISEYHIKVPIDDYSFRLIRIDCNTGELASDSVGHYTE